MSLGAITSSRELLPDPCEVLMTCYKPLIRVEFQNKWKTAKDGHQYKAARIMSTDDYEKFSKLNDELVKVQRLPCGQCIGCRLDYSKEWATRCVCESKLWKENYFVTLTYDEDHLPIRSELINKDTGQIYTNPGDWGSCLEPKDMQKFIKDLRRYWKYHYNHDNIRFFYCGEYGEKGKRAHYHIILFNLPIPQDHLDYLFANENFEPLYRCDIIEKLWGKGIVTVGEVTFSSSAYVARYITKKQKGHEALDDYLKTGRIPEFVNMSRKPGIGHDYFQEYKYDMYKEDRLIQHTCKGNNLIVKPPHYFDKKMKEEQPLFMEYLQEERKNAGETAEQLKRSRTDNDLKTQFHIKEVDKAQRMTALKRVLC